MRRLAAVGLGLVLAGGLAFVAATAPRRLPAAEAAALPAGDAGLGARIYWAAGCEGCHAAPGTAGEARRSLAGGLELKTDFGTFVAPNISPHPQDGVGGWSAEDFANALLRGVSPDGRHYYPAFPYTSSVRMSPQDVADLWAHLRTLPEAAGRPPGHSLAFPYSFRRGLGLWKLAFLDPAPVVALPTGDARAERGRYLVEGPGHCGECHTPRNLAGAMDRSRWLAGAPNPEGEGRIPNITTGEGGLGAWSEADLVYFFQSGFTPDFDSVGGSMAAVQRHLAMLPPEDLQAIASYLRAAPPQADGS